MSPLTVDRCRRTVRSSLAGSAAASRLLATRPLTVWTSSHAAVPSPHAGVDVAGGRLGLDLALGDDVDPDVAGGGGDAQVGRRRADGDVAAAGLGQHAAAAAADHDVTGTAGDRGVAVDVDDVHVARAGLGDDVLGHRLDAHVPAPGVDAQRVGERAERQVATAGVDLAGAEETGGDDVRRAGLDHQPGVVRCGDDDRQLGRAAEHAEASRHVDHDVVAVLFDGRREQGVAGGGVVVERRDLDGGLEAVDGLDRDGAGLGVDGEARWLDGRERVHGVLLESWGGVGGGVGRVVADPSADPARQLLADAATGTRPRRRRPVGGSPDGIDEPRVE